MRGGAASQSDASGDSSLLAHLSNEQRERLTAILDRYLAALETGAPLAQEALLADNPELADALRSYFRSLEDLHSMAAGFGGSTTPDPMSQRETEGARRIGDFELLREIGRGGMGVVYEARQRSLDRRVAVKLLPFAAVLDSRQIARFKHEAQAAAQIHHPNIVPVFAIGVERGVHYYAMQYIDGQPLDRAIEEMRESGQGSGFRVQDRRTGDREQGTGDRSQTPGDTHERQIAPTVEFSLNSTEHAARRSEIVPRGGRTPHVSWLPGSKKSRAYYRGVCELGVQAAEALHAAHEYGVVHRDIKPSNLLLEASGKLWITDFGLARFQRDASLTQTGDLIGTMRYMSPEQASGQSALVDHRTDIYSLGVTLYELVCLRPAFPEERGPALLKQIDSYDPPRPRQLRPDLPPDLETVILKAMAKSRDERYPTAEALAADLRCVLEGRATHARPPSLLDRMTRWTRRHGRAVLAATLVLALAVVGLSISTALVSSAMVQRQASERKQDRFYHKTRDVLDRFGLQLSEELADVPGAEAIRERMLRETRDLYAWFIVEEESDPQLRPDMALAYGKIGALLEQLGAAGEALAAYEKSQSLFAELAQERRGDAAIERQLALAENNVGLALLRQGKTQAGRELIEQAIRRQERLLARAPHDLEVQADLGLSLCNLGRVQQEAGELAHAEATYSRAVERLERLKEGRPNRDSEASHADARRLATAYNNLAGLCVASHPARAAKYHRQAIELLKTAAAGRPARLAVRRELGLSLHNLAAAQARDQQDEAAKRLYAQAIASREELSRLAPLRAEFQTDLALSFNNLAMVENRLGDHDAAIASFQRAIEIYRAVSQRLPDDLLTRSRLGGVYNNQGVAWEGAGKLEQAAEAFGQAAAVQRSVFEPAPDFGSARLSLARHYENQERVLRRLGRSGEADACRELAAQVLSKTLARPAAGYIPASDPDYDGAVAFGERKSSTSPLTRPQP
jgi:serine/threonine protein kinase/tetratricopeptide (TPR) repeat protein